MPKTKILSFVVFLLFAFVLFLHEGFTVDGDDNTVRLRDLDTLQTPNTVDIQPKVVLHAHSGVVTTLDFSPDGSTLVNGSEDGILRLWNTETAQAQEAIFTGDNRWIRAAAFLPDGIAYINRVSSEGRVHLWHATGGTQTLLTLPDFFGTAAFSPDGRTLASTNGNDAILLWDLATGERRAILEGHIHWIFELAFSPDGKTLASGGGDKAVLLWDVASGQHRATLDKQERTGGRRDDVFALAFSPDSKTLASSGTYGPIQLWDVNTLQRLSTLRGHTGEVGALAFSPDGKTLASGSWDGTILLWEASTFQTDEPQESPTAILKGHTKDITQLTFSPDSKTLASGGWDGIILLWELASQPSQIPWDANGDGVVNALDLTFIAKHFDQKKQESADINADGVVNILDLTFIASRFGQASPDLNGDGIVNILDLTIIARQIGE